jgi:hypothetical protein
VARLFDRGTLPGIKDSSGRRLVEEDAVKRLVSERKLQRMADETKSCGT